MEKKIATFAIKENGIIYVSSGKPFTDKQYDIKKMIQVSNPEAFMGNLDHGLLTQLYGHVTFVKKVHCDEYHQHTKAGCFLADVTIHNNYSSQPSEHKPKKATELNTFGDSILDHFDTLKREPLENVTQSEKGSDNPRDFLIMNYGWIEQAVDNGMDIRLDEIEVLSVMSAYAQSERSRAIDECIERLKSYSLNEYYIKELEKLKSRQ